MRTSATPQTDNPTGRPIAAILRPCATFFRELRNPPSPAVQRRRTRLAAIALALGAIAGLIELPLPLEDAYRAARAELRTHAAPDDIVVIGVDDATMNHLDWQEPSRRQEAQLISNLFRLGASKVVYDRAFSTPKDPAEDRAFSETVETFRGRVWLGATPPADNGLQQHDGLIPIPEIREHVEIASMMGEKSPFGLSVRFPTSTEIDGEEIPSISTVLSSYAGPRGWYRPDMAIDPQTVPTVSYIDVLLDQVPASEIAGKNVVVAPTHIRSSDLHYLPLGGMIPGVYFHVLGAHTLKDGMPLDLGWYPALLLVAAVIAIQARRKRPIRRLDWIVAGGLLAAPLAFDHMALNADIFPALIALLIASIGLHRIASRRYENATNLLKIDAAAKQAPARKSDVYSMKLQNLRDYSDGEDRFDAARFMEGLAKFLADADPSIASETEFALEKDTLVWCSPALSKAEIEEHGEGIIALAHFALNSDRLGARLKVALGIDVNHDLDMRKRIDNAMGASERATERSDRVCISDAAQLADMKRRRELLAELEAGIAGGTIGLGYQPKIQLSSQKVVGAETLLRWNHERLGPIPAQEAITIAEDHDLIDELTLYIFDRVMLELRSTLKTRRDFKVAINFSAQTLLRRNLADDIALMLSKHGVAGRSVIIEVTESILLDEDRTRKTISDLIDLGVQFSIDDFGTGYSNLEYIKQLPSAELKIDRRFVKSLGNSGDGDELVRGTIELAHSVSKRVVAEGVETKETADRLLAMGCDMAQGHYFSHALSAHDLDTLLRNSRLAA